MPQLLCMFRGWIPAREKERHGDIAWGRPRCRDVFTSLHCVGGVFASPGCRLVHARLSPSLAACRCLLSSLGPCAGIGRVSLFGSSRTRRLVQTCATIFQQDSTWDSDVSPHAEARGDGGRSFLPPLMWTCPWGKFAEGRLRYACKGRLARRPNQQGFPPAATDHGRVLLRSTHRARSAANSDPPRPAAMVVRLAQKASMGGPYMRGEGVAVVRRASPHYATDSWHISLDSPTDVGGHACLVPHRGRSFKHALLLALPHDKVPRAPSVARERGYMKNPASPHSFHLPACAHRGV